MWAEIKNLNHYRINFYCGRDWNIGRNDEISKKSVRRQDGVGDNVGVGRFDASFNEEAVRCLCEMIATMAIV